MSSRLFSGLLVVLLVLLTVTATLLVTTRADVSRLSAEVDELSGELERTRGELATAQEAAEAGGGAAGDPGLGGLLDGLLGGEGGLGGLLGGEGGLGGLLGGEGGEGGLGGLLGGGDVDLAACLTGDAAGAEGGLGGLGGALGGGGDPVEGDDAAAQIADITERVEQLRELERTEELDIAFLSSPDIEARVTALVLEDYPAEEADIDRRLLSALGAVPADLDLRQTQADLVSGQVAGFYEPETGELVVRSDDPDQPLGAAEQITLAHEVEHALADQILGLDVEEPDQPTDEARAGLAVVEGDATLTMQRFSLGAFSLTDQLALASDPEVVGSQQQLAAFPHVLQASLLFSYTEGLGFVCDRYAEGGWDAVDAAYADRPTTTAEILDPARYPAPAAEPRAPAGAGGLEDEGWEPVRSDTFGAADLLWLFEAPGDDTAAALDAARERAGDWAGGRVTVHTRGDDTAVGLALIGGAGDGPGLCESLSAWYDAAFPEAAEAPAEGAELARDGAGADAVLTCAGDDVRLGLAPELATARALAQ